MLGKDRNAGWVLYSITPSTDSKEWIFHKALPGKPWFTLEPKKVSETKRIKQLLTATEKLWFEIKGM